MNPPSNHQAFLLTPSGAGAIAVIRVVGTDAPAVVADIFRSKGPTSLTRQIADRLLYGRIVDGDEIIDDVLVSLAEPIGLGQTVGEAPAVDISCHGGVRIVERVLQALESRGVTVRDDSETTSRVWPARTMVEREAIQALAHTRTDRAVRFAARLRTQLVPRLEELADLVVDDRSAAHRELETLIAGYPAARALLNGSTVALVGPPNSGKSTLFNRLIGRAAALTSPIPGTTRDWVAEWVEIEGVPVNLIDTAGRHDASDPLERLAVECGKIRTRSADVRLAVLDGSRRLADAERGVLVAISGAAPNLVVANKSDLGCVWSETDLRSAQPSFSSEVVHVSATTAAGLEELRRRLLLTLGIATLDDTRTCLFTERQVGDARAALSAAAAPDAADLIRTRLIGS